MGDFDSIKTNLIFRKPLKINLIICEWLCKKIVTERERENSRNIWEILLKLKIYKKQL